MLNSVQRLVAFAFNHPVRGEHSKESLMKTKQSRFVWIVLMIVVVLTLVGCTVAPSEVSSDGQPTAGQIYVIGLASSAIVYVVCVLLARFPQWQLNKAWLSILVYVAALGLSIWFAGFTIPAFPAFADAPTFVTAVFGFLTALLTALGPTVAFAMTIYNIIWKRVLEALAAKVGLGAQASTTVLSSGRK
jgi:hypothetical protein